MFFDFFQSFFSSKKETLNTKKRQFYNDHFEIYCKRIAGNKNKIYRFLIDFFRSLMYCQHKKRILK